MIDLLKRHAIQVLRGAGHTLTEIGELVGVGKRSVQRVVAEPAVTVLAREPSPATRPIGRPAKAEPYRARVRAWLAAEPALLSVELLRRAKLAGYDGGKSAFYALVRELRPVRPRPVVRFEGLPGDTRDGVLLRRTVAPFDWYLRVVAGADAIG